MMNNTEQYQFEGELLRSFTPDNEWYQRFIIKNLGEPNREDNAYSAPINPRGGQLEGIATMLENAGPGSRWTVFWKQGKEKINTPGSFYQTITRVVSVDADATPQVTQTQHDQPLAKGTEQGFQLPPNHLAPRTLSNDERIARSVAFKDIMAAIESGQAPDYILDAWKAEPYDDKCNLVSPTHAMEWVNMMVDESTDILMGRWEPPKTAKEELFPDEDAQGEGESKVEETVE